MAENKKIEKALAVTAGVTIAAGAAYCASSAYVFSKVFKRKEESLYLPFTNALPNKLENDAWFGNVKKDAIWMLSEDDLLLHATSITQEDQSHRWVICMHGYGFYGTQILEVAKRFYQQGFNCVLPDMRAHGESEGSYSTLGWKEQDDLIQWIDWILKKDSQAEIVLHGMSIGANAILNVTGHSLPSNVKCAISDCAFSSVKNLLKYQISQYLKLPLNILIPGIDLLAKIKCGFNLNEASTLAQVRKSETPTLFIHGESDSFVPFQMMFDLFYECNARKDIISFSQARHADAFLNEGYFEKIFEFINESE